MNVFDPRLTRDDDHIYLWDGKLAGPSITQMMALCGVTDYEFLTEMHAQKGSAVHRGLELLEAGKLDWSSVDEVVGAHIESYLAFKKHTGFEPFRPFLEWAFFHPTLHYPGQIDVFGRVGEELWLCDYKTGTLEWFVGVQTWLQEQGIRAAGETTFRQLYVSGLGERKIKRFALRLTGSGRLGYDLEPCKDDRRDARVARAMLDLTRENIRNGGDRWLRKLKRKTQQAAPSLF